MPKIKLHIDHRIKGLPVDLEPGVYECTLETITVSVNPDNSYNIVFETQYVTPPNVAVLNDAQVRGNA